MNRKDFMKSGLAAIAASTMPIVTSGSENNSSSDELLTARLAVYKNPFLEDEGHLTDGALHHLYLSLVSYGVEEYEDLARFQNTTPAMEQSFREAITNSKGRVLPSDLSILENPDLTFLIEVMIDQREMGISPPENTFKLSSQILDKEGNLLFSKGYGRQMGVITPTYKGEKAAELWTIKGELDYDFISDYMPSNELLWQKLRR